MTIRDVIHNDIVIKDKLIIDLITTSEFQRMRKIRQLGLTYKVFSCAEHTRFSHSIGVYHLATIAIKNLELKKPDFATSQDIQAFLVSCLLHDIGHGPLSHAAEVFFDYSHEDFSCKIIREKTTQINQILSAYSSDMVSNVCLFIEKKHPNLVLNSLLSGSFDLDRMDYLLRDSHHCGVVYGNFESYIILSQLNIEDSKLIFNHKALKPIEDFILCRYQMFCQVYLNANALGYELLVELILKRVSLLLKINYKFKTDISKLIPFFEKQIPVIDYLKMNDFVFLAMLDDFQLENDKLLSELAKSFDSNQPVITAHQKKEDERYFKLVIFEHIKRRFYEEPILIKTKRGSIKNLASLSPLVAFARDSLSYKVEKQVVYVKR